MTKNEAIDLASKLLQAVSDDVNDDVASSYFQEKCTKINLKIKLAEQLIQLSDRLVT